MSLNLDFNSSNIYDLFISSEKISFDSNNNKNDNKNSNNNNFSQTYLNVQNQFGVHSCQLSNGTCHCQI